MDIIINGKFLSQKVTGVQRYAKELLKEFDKLCAGQQGKWKVLLAVPVNSVKVSYQNIEVVTVGRHTGVLWEQVDFPVFVKKKKGLALNLCNAAPAFSPGIVCIHDVKIKACPKSFSMKFLLWYGILYKLIIKRAEKIITVSEFSKSEIEKYYDVQSCRISVIPNAWQHFGAVECARGVPECFGLTAGNYFFSLGSSDPAKNFTWILRLAEKEIEEQFVIAGSINTSVFSGRGIRRKPDNVHFLGYVSDGAVKALMKYCKAFLFPSLYEGFGIPPLEAMSVGARVIVSDIPVMHEIFEESAIYINPERAADMRVEHCRKTDSEPVLRKYSWSGSARLLKEILDGKEAL